MRPLTKSNLWRVHLLTVIDIDDRLLRYLYDVLLNFTQASFLRSQRYLSLRLALCDRFNLILLMLQVFHGLSLLHRLHHLHCLLDGTLSWPSTLLLHWLLQILCLWYTGLIRFRDCLLGANYITWDFCLMTSANALFFQWHIIRILSFAHLRWITETILPSLVTIGCLSIYRSLLTWSLDLRLQIAWSWFVSLSSGVYFATTEQLTFCSNFWFLVAEILCIFRWLEILLRKSPVR